MHNEGVQGGEPLTRSKPFQFQVAATDLLGLLLVATLPWSTSATLILVALWALALIPTITVAEWTAELRQARSFLPVLFAIVGLAGMLWADVNLQARLSGFSSFWRFLLIPALIIHFQRSNNGERAAIAFLLSCLLLLALSIGSAIDPRIAWWRMDNPGVPFKNQITQSLEFGVCALCLLAYSFECWRTGRRKLAILSTVLALGFMGDIFFVATSRTELVAIAAMLFVLALRVLGWKGVPAGLAVVICLGVTAWFASPYLRGRIFHGVWEFKQYEKIDQGTSIGARLEFWRRSLIFVAEAPIIGHGTGSIQSLFADSATGKEWIGTSHAVGTHRAAAMITPNPHNQTFAVAIQLGLLGVAVMYAMWLAHLLCFTRPGLFESFGIMVMVQMIVGCAFNSHLFDFTEGWFYVLAVSVLIGATRSHNANWLVTKRLPSIRGG